MLNNCKLEKHYQLYSDTKERLLARRPRTIYKLFFNAEWRVVISILNSDRNESYS